MKTTCQIETLGPSFVRVDGVPMAPPDVRKNFVQTLKDASAPVIESCVPCPKKCGMESIEFEMLTGCASMCKHT